MLELTDASGGAVPMTTFSDAAATAAAACEGFIKRRDGTRGAYVHVTLAPLYDDAHRLISVVANVWT